MAEISDLQVLDANNTARFAEGQNARTVNDGARALEGILARWERDISGYTLTGGTGSAYTLTSNRSITSLAPGIAFIVRAHVANAGAATLNLNGLGAKDLVRQNGAALIVGDILVNQPLHIVYNASTDKFNCMGILA